MSTRMYCDICGRELPENEHVRLSVFRNVPPGFSQHYDLCRARDGNDVGCEQFVAPLIAELRKRARDRLSGARP